ncbi:ATP-binding cassette domain-containing protein [Aerococcaceae bacterium WGS1372]
MLQINHLTIKHLYNLTTLMEDVSFVVNPQDKLAIIGEEGNGKSTLLHYILNDSTIHNYLDIQGEKKNHFQSIGYLPQLLEDSQLNLTVEEFFFGSLDYSDIDYNRLYQIGSQLNFDIDRLYSQQLMDTLSGGERIKVQLIKLLIEDHDLLLLDEPSNDLDIETLHWLELFIQQATATIIFISHDVRLLEQSATSILHLEQIKHKELVRTTFAQLNYTDYMKQRELQFNKQMQTALKQREDHANKLVRHHRIEQSVTHLLRATRLDTAGRLLAKKMHAVKSTAKRLDREREKFEEIPIQEDAINIEFNQTTPVATSKPIISLYNETLAIEDNLLAENLSLNINANDKVGIIGQNGVGKSSFLKKILPILMKKNHLNVGFMPQNYEDSLREDETPIQFLTQAGSTDEQTQIMTYLASMRFLAEEMSQPIKNLSGGQRAKLLLLKFDLQGQNVLLLDEPTRNFSPTSQGEIKQVFRRFPGTLIAVSHDRQFLKEVCNRIVELTPTGFIELNLNDYEN